MVDFVKCWYRDADSIRENPLLDFRTKVNTRTGEAERFAEAVYKGLAFRIWDSGFLEFTGSLHKLKNHGLHNHDDFTYVQLCKMLSELQNTLGLDLKRSELHNIEFGVNIMPFVSTYAMLDHVISHRSKTFDSNYSGRYKYATHTQYTCKLYDKAAQYHLPNPIMRWELKFVRMEKVNALGIYTLNDLLKSDWIEAVGELLMQEWSYVLVYDTTLRIDEIKGQRSRMKALQWSNPNYWKALKRMQKSRELKRYKDCLQKHSEQLHYSNQVGIGQKWELLKSVTI